MASPSPFVISYFTGDLAACRHFYGEVLGLPVNSELPDEYFLAGAGGWRLQLLKTDDAKPGWETVSSGLVLFGVETEDELTTIRARLDAVDGRDPDGRIVMVQLYDPAFPFHD